MNLRRGTGQAVAGMIALAVLAIATALPMAASAQEKKELTVAIGSDFASLDPDKYLTWNDHWAYGNIFEGLYEPGWEGKLVPGLAEICQAAEDGLSYACTLRAGAKFHNGDPVTSEDVAFSLKRTLDPETRAQRAGMIGQNIAGIEVVDSRHFIVRLRAVDAMTIEKLSLYFQVKPKKYIEAVGNDEFARHPIGSGAFEFVERRPKEYLKLKAFEGHWGHVPKVSGVTIKIVPEEQSRLAQVLSGEADVASPVSPVLAARLKAMPNLQVVQVPSFLNVLLKLNTENTETSKKLVRQAIFMAIDRDQLMKAMMLGYATPQLLWCSQGQLGCDTTGVQPYPYDPKRAHELLEQANFDFSKPLRFVGMAPGRVTQSKETAEAIAQFLLKVGIKTDLDIVEFGTFTMINAAKEKDKSIAILFATQPDPYSDMSYRLDITMRIGAAGTWSNDGEVDAMVTRINGIIDPKAREQLFTKVLTRIHDEALYMPLWAVPGIFVASKSVDFKIPPNVAYAALWDVTKK